MPEVMRIPPTPREQSTSVRIAQLGERQWGVLSRAQLLRCGLSRSGISRSVARGHLHHLHPGVYAVGHRSLGAEGRLVAALLYAGPGAALSHESAAWLWELLEDPPSVIDVTVPVRHLSAPGVRVHHPRSFERVRHRHLPVTTVARTLLDVAARRQPARLRRMLAETDYRRLLDVSAVEALLGPGRPGAAALRAALAEHMPHLARTRSELEQRFLLLCRTGGIPLPEVNVLLEGFLVDALWRERRVAVELDGHTAHATPAAIERDRRRDLALRGAGFVVLRYTWRQVTREAGAVRDDLSVALRRLPLRPESASEGCRSG